MQGKAKPAQPQKLDEFALRDELKRLRAQIPDNPSLNPILNVAFDLSRRLETGTIAYDELKSLAGRIMDRACVHRAGRLRERIGYVDQAATLKDFTLLTAGVLIIGIAYLLVTLVADILFVLLNPRLRFEAAE